MDVSRRAVISSLAGATTIGGGAAVAFGRKQPLRTRTFSLAQPGYENWPQHVRDEDDIYSPSEAATLSLQTIDDEPGSTKYHGVQIARQLATLAQGVHYSTGKPRQQYLDAAVRLTDRIAQRVDLDAPGLWLSYRFDNELHNDESIMEYAPWVSGMAQGIALSAFARLAHLTEGKYARRFRRDAQRVFETLQPDRDAPHDGPWATVVDENGYYWIEEWPLPDPPHTLNGKIFAIFGLYEYWLATGSEDAKRLTRAALATISYHIGKYRVPDDVSWYCLGHKAQNTKYHQIHVEQLNILHRLTGVERFREAAQTFRSDWWPDEA